MSPLVQPPGELDEVYASSFILACSDAPLYALAVLCSMQLCCENVVNGQLLLMQESCSLQHAQLHTATCRVIKLCESCDKISGMTKPLIGSVWNFVRCITNSPL